MSEELKNAIVLIIAVSLALNFIAPTLVGNSSFSDTRYHAYKPASRDIIDTSYSGHLGQTPLSYDNPFPGLFPDSYKDDRVDLYQPTNQQFQSCGLCTCLTGQYSERPFKQLQYYSGEFSEVNCKLTCQNNGFSFIAFSEDEKVACDYILTR